MTGVAICVILLSTRKGKQVDIFTKLEAKRRNSSSTFFQSKSGTAVEVLGIQSNGWLVMFYDKDGDWVDERVLTDAQLDRYIYRLPTIY